MRAPAFLLALIFTLAPPPLRAGEVTIEHNRLTLNADLNLAEGKTIEDGVILMTHARLQHNRMEIIRVFSELFRENGYSTLAMTYSAALDNRRGPYDCAVPHRHSLKGHLEELRLWVDWLKGKGAGKIILAAHSGGANMAADFMGGRDDPFIQKIVLVAPSTADHYGRTPEGYRIRWRKELQPILDRAQSLVDAGQGDTLMKDIDLLFCARAEVSANTFLSYYDQAKRYFRLLPQQMKSLRKPTLVIAASEDNVAPDMARMVAPFVDGKRLRFVMIEGCGHFFRDLCADDAVEAAVKFLEE